MHRSIQRCTTCRVSVLDAFTSLAGISIPASVSSTGRNALISPIARSRSVHVPVSRPFHHLIRLNQSQSQSPSPPQSESQTTENEPSPDLNNDISSTSSTSSSIPWYLQVPDPTPPITPLTPQDLLRQEIPPLPANPPSILPSILDHLSTHIGLDDLIILDLRDMNPPPALGSNLLMIIGTARSVKHLNVSADRFCRWARKEYKLRPYADGLLGRNELKLKLRRKARRLRLAQSVGNTLMDGDHSADDGITTGWICVNMGQVDDDIEVTGTGNGEGVAVSSVARDENGRRVLEDENEQELEEDEEEEYENPPGPDFDLDQSSSESSTHKYAGFGDKDSSTRIVVQMFTELKRNEMDLEGLWGVRNTRLGLKSKKADVEFGEGGIWGEGVDGDEEDVQKPFEHVERNSRRRRNKRSTGADVAAAVDKADMERSWDQSAGVKGEERV
ncbi:hypothetical protein PV10_04898 [Exophiala mesophila]|uniref:ATPase synthesis protein 25 n=1 Tax=Exophiala mesophila TaxID=212818 RepID=A0A0D1ZG88_EXOME|nr:uncharacterized protein PV10_04898 [Exophiala mesophila]KIV93702.1 hypothetical protein PV10_04898 [Exophiala mesophila]